MRLSLRAAILSLVWLAGVPGRASAEWQLKPFLGVTFGGGTSFVDLEEASGHPNLAVGISGVLLGDVLGVEVDLGDAPGFFQYGDRPLPLVVKSSATTLTGNLVVTLPRRLTEYSLRPYFAGGAGLMHVRIDDFLGFFRVTSTLPAMDVGGGVTGFLTKRLGVNWDVRYFRSVGGADEGRAGLSFGPEQLSFWRANMGLAIRY
jgi:hypothetical protein